MSAVDYIVIAPDGEVARRDGNLDFRAELGPEGHARVPLHPSSLSAGWVNDCGLLFPEKYPRNIVGSCVLISLGARPQPYAGQVVITGWRAENTLLGLIEICPLRIDPAILLAVHDDVRRALAGEPVPSSPPGWEQDVRAHAEQLRTCPTPGITFGTVWLEGE